jgi:4-hydroxy-4-methyl-2-oxoglutarate aldolase
VGRIDDDRGEAERGGGLRLRCVRPRLHPDHRPGVSVYCAGICPLDSKGRGRVMAYDVPVQCGDVLVQPGEIIFADYDGIVVIPREAEETVIQRAMEKVEGENKTRVELQQGKTLREVYDEYGIL